MNKKLFFRVYLGITSAIAIFVMLCVNINALIIKNGVVTDTTIDLAFIFFVLWLFTCGIPAVNLAIVTVVSIIKKKFFGVEFFIMLFLSILEIPTFFMGLIFAGFMWLRS